MNFLNFIDFTLENPSTLISTVIVTTVIKIYTIYRLLKNKPQKRQLLSPWTISLILIFCAAITEISWIPKLLYESNIYQFNYSYIIFILRIAWLFFVIQAQATSLLLECLLSKKYKLTKIRLISFVPSVVFALYYLYIAVFNFHIVDKADRIARWEYSVFTVTFLYMIGLFAVVLFQAHKKMRRNELPKILHKQLEFLIRFLIIPFIFADTMVFNPIFRTYNIKYFSQITDNYLLVSISIILWTASLYFTIKKIIELRFSNIMPHVQTTDRFEFINDFKNILEQLGHVTDLKELRHLTKIFFKDAFNIPANSLHFTIRPDNHIPTQEISNKKNIEAIIEQFLNRHATVDCPLGEYLIKHQILIHDEIAFNHFYEYDKISEEILNFLNVINADIFLPIFDKHSIIGCIIIESNARNSQFYNNVERDEMLVYTSYLSNIITLLNHKNLQSILAQEKELKEELFNKHQEIGLYKESIRSFLRTSKERKIGIVFYKNGKLKLGNHAAQELIGIDLIHNNNEGHPTKKTLKHIGRFVQEYKQAQTAMIQDSKGDPLVCDALLNIDGTHIIILIHYPEIADVVKNQIDLLKDPSKWDYLLYLETTKSGHLINRLIPSSTESILNFKIDLLKTALTTKATLLDLPEKDLDDTVRLIHNISLRPKLETIVLTAPEKGDEIAIKLFGINPIFGIKTDTPLLETLKSGTLFIKNIHYLSISTQRLLTNVIKYGYYTTYKGPTRNYTDVRILCSSDQNLESMVNNKFFCEKLYQELKKTSLAMPSLLTLPEHELAHLAVALSEQAVNEQPLKNLLELSISEKNKLIHKRPISLHELRDKIHQLIEKKSKKTDSIEKVTLIPAQYVSEPDLTELQSLGTQALKDAKICAFLRKKFKNPSEIAKFLGVHRSTVSRRLKTLKDSGS